MEDNKKYHGVLEMYLEKNTKRRRRTKNKKSPLTFYNNNNDGNNQWNQSYLSCYNNDDHDGVQKLKNINTATILIIQEERYDDIFNMEKKWVQYETLTSFLYSI